MTTTPRRLGAGRGCGARRRRAAGASTTDAGAPTATDAPSRRHRAGRHARRRPAATTGRHGGGGGGDYVIGVSNTLAGNGWREEMICAVKAQSLASGQVSEVIAISKNGGPTEQIQDLQNLISQGVNAIIVNPSDREQLNPVIEEAIAQGIVVVAVDQAVTAEGAYVATQRPGRVRPPRRPVAGRRPSAARAACCTCAASRASPPTPTATPASRR